MCAENTAVAEIQKLLGRDHCIDEIQQMQPYLTSWRDGKIGQSPLVTLPSTSAQVSGIVTICQRYGIPVVPQGGNTGLVGGSVPSRGNEIIINLSRMNKVRALDPVGAIVTAESGVILQNLKDVAAEAGFIFPLSMASEGSAQLGGAISTNAGGTAVLRYGNMRALVMGVEVVLPNGQLISALKKLPKDNTGYHLSDYFIGAEGTLGIVTAATIKLFPAIKQTITAIVTIPDAHTALDLLHLFRSECAEHLSTFEIMSLNALQLVIKQIPNCRFPVRVDGPYYLLIELGSSSPIVPLQEIFEQLITREMEKNKILDTAIATNAAQTKQFWSLRENIPEALRLEGNRLHFDISLPLDQLAVFLDETEPLIKKVARDMCLIPFGHIGDGNLHYNMYYTQPRTPDDAVTLKKEIEDIVFGAVRNRQGSISAEHGIGTLRKTELISYKSAEEIGLMKTIKHAIDPKNLMNPGKIFDC
jgi:FAD/FMN-containing dehydrogenase